ncbi:hypothetical protein EON66_01020 [archaeon]|nr:MAG: hypothetical protein EON66_01020 [archaeon]
MPWDIVEAPDGVSVALYHKQRKSIILVRQFRPAVRGAHARVPFCDGLHVLCTTRLPCATVVGVGEGLPLSRLGAARVPVCQRVSVPACPRASVLTRSLHRCTPSHTH